MDVFERCHQVNDLLACGSEGQARSELIRLLDDLRRDGVGYPPLVNRLIREVGLFPYMRTDTASWEERFVYEAFKADVGGETKVLHREQSRLLNMLLAGKSIAVSAPTSFGKSFVIDSFIAIREPENVVILVPTIALADETRRRIHKKFSSKYKIITTSDQTLSDRNILIFPQERAMGYIPLLPSIDMLIVDEFYKASREFDPERAPALMRAIIELGKASRQRYYLAPNISELKATPFTEGMDFLRLDFHTVVLDKIDLYEEIAEDKEKKNSVLLNILQENPSKTLIYAGTYTNIDSLSNLLMTSLAPLSRHDLATFRSWLAKNYDPNWSLPNLVSRGIGVHNGRLHRSLSQIQVRLFEQDQGLDTIISTSSIIEGVNTSAETVVLWSNKNGRARIDDFTYKNIIGRGGRMFRHFVGKVYVLEAPPAEAQTQLELVLPDELVGTIDELTLDFPLTGEQELAAERYRSDMQALVGIDGLKELQEQRLLQSSNSSLTLKIAQELYRDGASWRGLQYLNSSDPEQWDYYLYKLINLQPAHWGTGYRNYVEFVKVLSRNWRETIPSLLHDLSRFDLGINSFFELERNTTFRLSSLLRDVQTIYNKIYASAEVDVSLAIARFSHAFLPVSVYQLEEYGLPRMVARKIHRSGLVNFEKENFSLHDAINELQGLGFERIRKAVGELDDFDLYILRFFFEGIQAE